MENKHHNITSAFNSYALNPDQVGFIVNALETGDRQRVLDHVAKMHAADITELLNVITKEHRRKFIAIIGDDFDGEVLVDLDPDVKDAVIDLLGAQQSAQAITKLEHDDAVQVIEDLEKQDQEEILEAIPQEQRDVIAEALSYPEDSAGRMMNKNFVAVPANWNVGKTIDYLRSTEDIPDIFYSIYLLDRQKRPIGTVLISKAIRNEREIKIKDLMEEKIYTIDDVMDQEEVAYIFRKYALASAPVIDRDGKAVGVITVDDVVDVMDEEAEEDILHLGGVHESDIYADYMDTAVHRFPWLLVNLITAIAASAVIAMFAESIERLVALAVLMPIVASMAGNAGTQTLTIAVRAIATKDLTETNAARVVKKEILSSAVNGILFAGIMAAVSYVYYGDIYLSFVLAFAMVGALILAAFSGALIPLGLARIGVDPAIASGVFLTTITDISAFFFFLGLASIWLL